MTRLQRGNHSTVVTGSNDGTKQVSKDAWNAAHNQTGFLGFTAQGGEILIASGVLAAIDTLTVVGAESGTSDALDRFDNTDIADKDFILLFPTSGDTITVTHTESPSVAGQIHLNDHTSRILLGTEPLVLIRVGDYWYEPNYPKIFLDSEFKIVDESDVTKKFILSIGGATTGKTLTLISSHTDNRSITLPDGTTTLAGLAIAQSFSAIQTFSLGIAVPDGVAILDANGNEILKILKTASAVNEFTMQNSATGNPILLSATGDDTNISAQFVPKGTGFGFGFIENIEVALSDESTLPTTGVKYTSLPAQADYKIIGLPVAGALVAGTGATLVEVDILVEDSVNANTFTTIFSTRPTIDASEFTSTTAATPCALTSTPTTVAKGKRVQYKIHAIDSNSLVRGIKVGMRVYHSAV